MPIITKSTYLKSPRFQFNRHIQTIIPALRKIEGVDYERERITTKDNDFLDLDWLVGNNKQLVILTHGLEGNTQRSYIKSAAKFFNQHSWDVLAWNCRSCSGEMNRAKRLYSHGEIDDIGEVLQHALQTKNYEKVIFIGYSMGGNITMKYLGVNGKEIPDVVKAGLAFSSPTDLKASMVETEKTQNYIYNKRFLLSLKEKMKIKAQQYPDLVNMSNFKKVKNWDDFMTYYYAPLHDHNSLDEFYHYASSRNFVSGTNIPILLVNALNDPLLSPECSPFDIADTHPLFHIETPKTGGHVGFGLSEKWYSWMDERALSFVS